MNHEFQRVAIVNRGEAAMRFIHAAREINLEQGLALRSIALFTEPDRNAMFVREADEALCLGPANVLDPNTQQLKSTYVDYERLAHALASARAEAVWVGWGFVAEHAAFSDLCRELGIVFIGPSGDAMRLVGDKIASKRLAEQAHIPVVPWSEGPVETLSEAIEHAERLSYPLLIKATAGGGGHGIRKVLSPSELPQAFERARCVAFKAFGDPTVFLEQLAKGTHHVEAQVLADHYGTTWAVGVRDCTIQRRHQKVLEEAPSPALSVEQDTALRQAAVRLSKAAGYQNAGTVEFLYAPESGHFWFMEMNTRLQVEHPVTELTTGLDLVKLQIHIARGGRLEGEAPRTKGHAIEVRLNAEDPDNAFAPAPGVIQQFRMPTGPGIRIDTGVAEGDSIAVEFDSMIAKIIAHGQNRNEALARLQRALRESVVVIEGGASNKPFLLDLLGRPEVQRGEVNVEWLDHLAANGNHVSRCYADVALIQAAIEAYDAELAIEQSQFYASAARGRPQVRNEAGRKVELRYRGNCYSIRTYRLGPQQYRVESQEQCIDVRVDRLGKFEHWLTVFGRRFHIVSIVQGLNFRIEVDGVSHKIDRDDGGIVHAPSPSVVVSIAVKPGESVSAGDRLAVLEAMKMEMQVVAPFSGKVRQVMTMPNVQVDAGTPLLQIEPEAGDNTIASGERVKFGASIVSDDRGETVQSNCQRGLEELRRFMLGFDVDPKYSTRLLTEWSQTCPVENDKIRNEEDEILNIFVDLCCLFQREPDVNHRASGEEPSSEAYLFAYLRMIDTRGEGLPPSFVASLQRALAHYGVRTLDPSPQLEENLLWIYKSHQRLDLQIAPVLGLLERRLRHVESLAPLMGKTFRTLLDRMIAMTNGYFPAVSDLAREVRYRYFDQALFERARKQVYDRVEEQLAYMAANPNAADRHERLRALVECPQPLVAFLSGRFVASDVAMRKLMLEAITWRYYRIRTLMDPRSLAIDGHCYAVAEYEHEGKRIHVFTTHAEYSRLPEAVQAVAPLFAAVPEEHDIVLDFYTWHNSSLGAPVETQQQIQKVLSDVGFPRAIRRIVVTVAASEPSEGVGGMQHFTYRPHGNRYEEEKLYRGLHPMMAKRLHLWRLSNFNIERLPSVEDVYLLHGVARENPKDERLFASAEVRDVTPLRNETGRIVQLPHLERMFTEALAGIRSFQWRRRPQQRLHWNRIFLYVWPPLNLERDELRDIVQRLSPATEGLGLEQVIVRARIPNPATGELRDMVVRISSPVAAVCSLLSGLPTSSCPSNRWENTNRRSSACASADSSTLTK
jgi:acetyl/propionyl-CoA carboxylase alpha subunit